MKKKISVIVIIILIISHFNLLTAKDTQECNPFFKLKIYIPFSNYNEYAQEIAKNLEEINIEAEIIEEWLFIGTPQPTPARMIVYELGIFNYDYRKSPNILSLFSENEFFNIIGLNKNIPYFNESEQTRNQALATIDLDTRQELYYNWQNIISDKILPLYPFMFPRIYEVVWANTMGYENRWGIVKSLPYMRFYGFHEGQKSLNEFSIADANWRELNPLFCKDKAGDLIIDLITEPILQMSPDFAPLKNGLVYDWEQIEESHYKFYLRDNVHWNPSYNITLNRDNSTQLEISPLMNGLQGSFSNGSNQKLTAKDAVFTLLAWANPITSDISEKYEWLIDCYVDQNDTLSFHIIVDSNPHTPEKEPYVEFWSFLNTPILPEFFLNSSSDEISYTDGGIKCWGLYPEIMETPQWISFSTSAFGCGKFMLHYYTRKLITTLKRSPYWFGVGAIDGSTGLKPFVERFNIHTIPSSSEALKVFKNGNLDLASLTLFPEERKQMQTDPEYYVLTHILYVMRFLAFNLDRDYIGGQDNKEWLNDTNKADYTRALAVRKAICYIIDREEMNQKFHDGEYFIINDIMIHFFTYFPYSEIFNKYERDLDLAWEWMEAAGYIRPDASKFNLSFGTLLILNAIILYTIYKKRMKRQLSRNV